MSLRPKQFDLELTAERLRPKGASSVFDPEDFGVSSVERSDPKGASAELLVVGRNTRY